MMVTWTCSAQVEMTTKLRGIAGFSSQKVIAATAGTRGRSVYARWPRGRSVYAADLDGDNDMDVLSASSLGDARIAWYRNDGTGSFSRAIVIANAASVDSGTSVHAADLDNDGHIDVLSASGNDNKIAWYRNNGTCLLEPEGYH